MDLIKNEYFDEIKEKFNIENVYFADYDFQKVKFDLESNDDVKAHLDLQNEEKVI